MHINFNVIPDFLNMCAISSTMQPLQSWILVPPRLSHNTLGCQRSKKSVDTLLTLCQHAHIIIAIMCCVIKQCHLNQQHCRGIGRNFEWGLHLFVGVGVAVVAVHGQLAGHRGWRCASSHQKCELLTLLLYNCSLHRFLTWYGAMIICMHSSTSLSLLILAIIK